MYIMNTRLAYQKRLIKAIEDANNRPTKIVWHGSKTISETDFMIEGYFLCKKKKNVFFHVMYKSGCSSDICSSFRCQAMPEMPKARALKSEFWQASWWTSLKSLRKNINPSIE